MGNDRCKREGAMQYPRTKIKRGRIKPDVLCRLFFYWHHITAPDTEKER